MVGTVLGTVLGVILGVILFGGVYYLSDVFGLDSSKHRKVPLF